ncbi:UbiA family prenyltransferase [Amycolatopsis pithecellobii]|uniref:Prenyltransferase n=1 Tax=Amycolatopsis pithecellobii TaxID=664692 RepID=A0A6N7YYV4_9PSEU|nr:UbiA family prenyltransferase [Amycolatopsis pithecellobii]MTD57078.1 hypothetical protein [Amycolatopsis pithecellobii]
MLETRAHRVWRDVVLVHRLQFPLPVSYLGVALWGACFAVGAPEQLASWPVLTVIVANILLILGPLALNVALDRELDSRHREKNTLATAAKHFGGNGLVVASVAEMVAGLLIAGTVSVVLGRPQITLTAAGIVVLHLLYNVEPVRLKRHGMTGAAVFGIGATTGPALLTYFAVAANVPAPIRLAFAGLGVMAIGRTAWWSLPDRAADLAAGQQTPVARYGLRGTVVRSCLLLVAGLVLLAWGLVWRFGPALAVAGIAAYALFLADVLRTRRHPGTARRMLRRAMPLIACGDVLLAVIALAG